MIIGNKPNYAANPKKKDQPDKKLTKTPDRINQGKDMIKGGIHMTFLPSIDAQQATQLRNQDDPDYEVATLDSKGDTTSFPILLGSGIAQAALGITSYTGGIISSKTKTNEGVSH